VHIVGLLTDWRLAVLNAGSDAHRFQTAAKERAGGWLERRQADGSLAACRKSNPNILVVQPAQDRAAKNGPGQFDGARDRRILLQR
jgi:hypothetical protein